MSYCSKCGKENLETISFCPSCGNNLKRSDSFAGTDNNSTYTVQTVVRPISITIICVACVIGCFLEIFDIGPKANTYSIWYQQYIIVSSIIMIIGLYGLWQMKKWGAWMTKIIVTLDLVAAIVDGPFSLPLVAVNGIPTVIILGFINKHFSFTK